MIDWSARANAIFQQKPPTPTDKGDETPVVSVSSVGSEGVSDRTEGGFVGFVGGPPDPFRENAIPAEIDERINRMVRDGAIDDDDAALVRRRFHAYAAEWLLVLDACEAAAIERGPESTCHPLHQTRKP